MVAKSIDLTGKTQGRLTVIKHLPEAPVTTEGKMYLCECRCGNKVEYRTCQLNHKYSPRKSCGRCKDSEKFPKEYSIYTSMLQRCRNPTNSRYSSYGGRGIEVSNSWRYDFLNFVEDLGRCPSPLHSLDRIDVDGNYCKENCRWATSAEQNLNKRKTWYREDIIMELRLLILRSSVDKKSLISLLQEYYNFKEDLS